MAWHDEEPVRGGYPDPKLPALSGLERMRAGVEGTMPAPPITHLFGVRPIAAGPASVDGRELTATAQVVHRGRSLAVAQGDIVNADGKKVVVMTSSAAIRSGGSWGSLVDPDEITRPSSETGARS